MTPRAYTSLLEAPDRFEFLVQKYAAPLAKKVWGWEDPDPHPQVFSGEWLTTKTTQSMSPSQRNQSVQEHMSIYVQELCRIDPTVPEGSSKYAGKYTEWLIRAFLAKPSVDMNMTRFLEDGYKIREDLEMFSRIQGRLPIEKRDIMKVNGTDELYALVKPFRGEIQKTKAQVSKDVITVADTPEVSVYIPKTFEAARMLGGDTRWCTSSSGGQATFDDYTTGDYGEPLLIVFAHALDTKFQLHFESDQFMDADNRHVSLFSLFRKVPSLRDILIQWAKQPVSGPDSNLIAKKLTTLGAYDAIKELFDEKRLVPANLYRCGPIMMIRMHLRSCISLKELQNYGKKGEHASIEQIRYHNKKVPMITYEDGGICTAFLRGWTDTELHRVFKKGSGDAAYAALDYNYFEDSEPESWKDVQRGQWGHFDMETLTHIWEAVEAAGVDVAFDQNGMWSTDQDALDALSKELREKLAAEYHLTHKVIDAICAGAGDARMVADCNEVFEEVSANVEELLGRASEEGGKLCFRLPYAEVLKFLDVVDGQTSATYLYHDELYDAIIHAISDDGLDLSVNGKNWGNGLYPIDPNELNIAVRKRLGIQI